MCNCVFCTFEPKCDALPLPMLIVMPDRRHAYWCWLVDIKEGEPVVEMSAVNPITNSGHYVFYCNTKRELLSHVCDMTPLPPCADEINNTLFVVKTPFGKKPLSAVLDYRGTASSPPQSVMGMQFRCDFMKSSCKTKRKKVASLPPSPEKDAFVEDLASRPVWDSDVVNELILHGVRPELVSVDRVVTRKVKGNFFRQGSCTFRHRSGKTFSNIFISMSLLKFEYHNDIPKSDFDPHG